MKRKMLPLALGAAISIFVLTCALFHSPPKVTASLRAVPISYDGDCPAVIQFFGTITARKPGEVRYRFSRSDGALTPIETLYFTDAGAKTVSTSWTSGKSGRGWQSIQVIHPQRIESAQAAFTIQCQAQTAERFRFVVFGDSQDEGGWTSWFTDSRGVNGDVFGPLVSAVAKLSPKPSLVVFLGDMSLDSGIEEWEDWKKYMKPLIDRRVQVYNVVGNHELGDSDEPELEWQKRYQRFFSQLPSNGPPRYEYLAYSFEYSNSSFTILDSFYVYPRGGYTKGQVSAGQRSWLASQLAETKKVHKFAFSHAPALSVTGGSGDQMLWRYLMAGDFDALFSGHEHLYARWVKGTVGYPLQIISGGAGGELSGYIKNRPAYPDSGRIYNRGHHFVVVDVTGRTVSVTAITIEAGRIRPVDHHLFTKRSPL